MFLASNCAAILARRDEHSVQIKRGKCYEVAAGQVAPAQARMPLEATAQAGAVLAVQDLKVKIQKQGLFVKHSLELLQ